MRARLILYWSWPPAGCNNPTYSGRAPSARDQPRHDGRRGLPARHRSLRAAGAEADRRRAERARAEQQQLRPDDAGAVGGHARLRHRDRVVDQEPRHDGRSPRCCRSTAATSSATTCRARTSIPPPTSRIRRRRRRCSAARRSISRRTRCATACSARTTSHEAALDLEAITRYPDPAATCWRRRSRSSSTTRTRVAVGLESIPPNDVTPAMVRYAFTLSADGHVALDYTVRVRDHSGKLASPDRQEPVRHRRAAMLAPPVAPPAATMPALRLDDVKRLLPRAGVARPRWARRRARAQVIAEPAPPPFPDPKKFAKGLFAPASWARSCSSGKAGQLRGAGAGCSALRLGYDLFRWLAVQAHVAGVELRREPAAADGGADVPDLLSTRRGALQAADPALRAVRRGRRAGWRSSRTTCSTRSASPTAAASPSR